MRCVSFGSPQRGQGTTFGTGFFITWARRQYREVFFLGGGGTELLTKAIAVEPVETFVFQVPEWASARNALPDGPRRTAAVGTTVAP